MASPGGGRFLIGAPAGFTGTILGVNDGTNPVFPTPVVGSFNVEVFTAVGAAPTTPDAGFQTFVIDPGGNLTTAPGFLTGTTLTLSTGNYLLVDSVTGAAGQGTATINLGSGNQTVVGAPGDTIQGGSGAQVINAISQFSGGAEAIFGGSGPTTVFGGPGDSVVAGSGSAYIDGTAGKMPIVVGSGGTDSIIGTASKNTISGSATAPDVIVGGSAAVVIFGLGKGDVVAFGNQTGNAIINATAGNIGATLGGGAATVFGGIGDTVNLGSVGQYADGGSGKMAITLGTGGVDSVFGSSVPGGADTLTGGSATLLFNPQTGGGGDLLNLSKSSGMATINAFSAPFKGVQTDIPNINDTIMAGSGTDSVFGGQGDRIGVGTSSTAGGTHLFDHSTTLANAAVAFGTNDSVVGTSSTAKVTVTNFAAGTDSLFYQNESSPTNNSIVASATQPAGTSNSVITLPDGTTLTIVGITPGTLSALNVGGLLFKP